MPPAPLSECAEFVREYDNDRFLSALFAPADYREDLFALYAFNLELSKIRETVSEPLIGRMRLQFWRDTIPQLSGDKPPSHYLAEALASAVKLHELPAAPLIRSLIHERLIWMIFRPKIWMRSLITPRVHQLA